MAESNESAESLLGRRLEVVDRADHGVTVEVVFVFLTHTQEVDEEFECLLFGAVVEEHVFADGREWFRVVFSRRRRLHIGLRVGLRLCLTLFAGLLVSLPVCLLTVFVAITDGLAAGTLKERNVRGTARSAGSSFGHCRLDRKGDSGNVLRELAALSSAQEVCNSGCGYSYV